jgi:hypothetical protein
VSGRMGAVDRPARESPTLHDDPRPAGCHRLTHVAATWRTEFKGRCVA